MTDAPHTQPAPGPTTGLVTLAGLLNILWRRKLIILVLTLAGLGAGILYVNSVTPLHRGTAQVQPGITAYSENGGPVREWRLKDIVRYYRRGLYDEDLRRILDRPADLPRPIIQAEFIPRGSQNIQGGSVVTLETLSPEPAEAARILEAAIQAFNIYAAADTLSSGIHLTRHGLEVQVAELRNQVAQLATEKERLGAKITEAESELERIERERELLRIDLARVELDSAYRSASLVDHETEAEAKRQGAELLEQTLERLRNTGLATPGRDSLLARAGDDRLAAYLLARESGSQAEVLGELVLGSLRMRSEAFRDQASADSLRHANEMASLYVEDIKIQRGIELDKRRAEVVAELADLRLQQQHDLEFQRISLEQQIRGREIQLRALSPLERIGTITTTKRPVRPRKLRAITILTGLGLFGSIALAFVWEYLSRNRDVILAKSPRRD